MIDYKSWNAQQVASVLASHESIGGANLSDDHVKSLYDVGFDGSSLHNIVQNIKMENVKYAIYQLERTYNKNNKPQLSNACQTVVFWIVNRLLPNLNPTSVITIEPRNLNDDLDEYINKISSVFKHSISTWKSKIQEEEKRQQTILLDLYKSPLLPDHLNAFQFQELEKWSSHWDSKRIPHNKGEELRNLLSKDSSVERDSNFVYSILCFLDLSTSGKTYTIFNLANSKPTEKKYQKFFVLYVTYNSLLFNALQNTLEDHLC